MRKEDPAGTDPADDRDVPTQPAKKAEFPCLRCNKNITEKSKSVQCNTCDLWVHVECEQISPELFNILADPEKFGAVGISWNCVSCMARAARLQEMVRSYEERLQKAEEIVSGTEATIQNLNRKVEKMETALQKKDKDAEERVLRVEEEVYRELRERECRKLSVIFHKLGENEEEKATGMQRMEWDKKSCVNIFNALKLGLTEEAIKFCRRLGKKREEPRPLVVGFYLEADRVKLLRNARLLQTTKFKDVNVGRDLTKKQREEETELRREAVKRNEGLTDEDVSKNLRWAVVGARGERRLVKVRARGQGRRGRGGAWRGAVRGPTRGAWSGRTGRGTLPSSAKEEEEMEGLAPATGARWRRNKRRERSEDDELNARPVPKKR